MYNQLRGFCAGLQPNEFFFLDGGEGRDCLSVLVSLPPHFQSCFEVCPLLAVMGGSSDI